MSKKIQELVSTLHNKATRGDTIYAIDVIAAISEEQAESADKMERQTNKLISLTYVLVFLTVALFAVAFVQTRIMVKEYSSTNPPRINTSQHYQTPSTNK